MGIFYFEIDRVFAVWLTVSTFEQTPEIAYGTRGSHLEGLNAALLEQMVM